MQEDSPNDAARIPSKPVSLPAQTTQAPQNAQPLGNQLPDFPAAPSTLAPPLGWPRVDIAEVAARSRHIDTAVSFPYRKPLVGSAVPKPLEHVRGQIAEPVPPRPTPNLLAPSVPINESEWDDLESAEPELSEPQTDGAPSDWHPQESRVAEVKRPSVLARLSVSTAKSASMATARLHEWREKSGVALEDAVTRSKDSSRVAILRSRAGVQRLHERFKAIRIDMSPVASAFQRIRDVRVTVRIPKSNFRPMAAFSNNAKAVQARLQRNIQSNERLWTSMAMAGLSALLALGVVVGLRRFDPAYPGGAPETVSASTAPKTSASVMPARAAVVSKRRPSPVVAARVGVENAALRNSVMPSQRTVIAKPAPAANPKPKVRRSSEDDDYVAPDTYVRYSRNDKRSR